MDHEVCEGWKQVGPAIKYSPRQAYRYFKLVGHLLSLRHWLGPGHRMIMAMDEIEQFKILIIEYIKQTYYARKVIPKCIPVHVTICQGSLFD